MAVLNPGVAIQGWVGADLAEQDKHAQSTLTLRKQNA